MAPRNMDLREINNLELLCDFKRNCTSFEQNNGITSTSIISTKRECKEEHSILISEVNIKRGFYKRTKNKTTLVPKKKKKSTGIKNLEAKPQLEDSLSALAEEEEPRKWTPCRILDFIKQRDGIRNSHGLLRSFRSAVRNLSDLRREEDLLRQPQRRICRNPYSIKGMSL